MQPTLDTLDPDKQAELQSIVEQILQSDVTPVMIILFGSHARGDAVKDIHFTKGGLMKSYISDLDLLIVVETESEAHKERPWEKLQKQLERSDRHSSRISVIKHDIRFINKQLKLGHYFFADIKKEGILLYTTGQYTLEEAGPFSMKDRQKQAKLYFEEYYDSALGFFRGYRFYLEQKDHRRAAFALHQVTENLLNTILLVFTHYKPKSHEIEVLERLVASQYPEIIKIFPRHTKAEITRFNQLKKFYIDSRYTLKFKISLINLQRLSFRIEKLRELTLKICMEKLESFVPGALKADWYQEPENTGLEAPVIALGERLEQQDENLREARKARDEERKAKEVALRKETEEREAKESALNALRRLYENGVLSEAQYQEAIAPQSTPETE